MAKTCEAWRDRVLVIETAYPVRKRLILVAQFTIAASLVVWLVLSGRLEFRLLTSVRFSTQFLLLLALILGSLALPALRWWWLLRIQKLDEPLWDVTALTWLGYFTALVLPGAASGDLARSYLMVRRPLGLERSRQSWSTASWDSTVLWSLAGSLQWPSCGRVRQVLLSEA